MSAMNPKLMAALRAKRKPAMPEAAEPAAEEMGETMATESAEKGADYHHEQIRKHIDKAMRGTRRGVKISLKLIKHHHDLATGMTKAGK